MSTGHSWDIITSWRRLQNILCCLGWHLLKSGNDSVHQSWKGFAELAVLARQAFFEMTVMFHHACPAGHCCCVPLRFAFPSGIHLWRFWKAVWRRWFIDHYFLQVYFTEPHGALGSKVASHVFHLQTAARRATKMTYIGFLKESGSYLVVTTIVADYKRRCSTLGR